MEAHFKQQIKQYGNLTLVSLVNNKGHELPVKLSYERWISHVSDPSILSKSSRPDDDRCNSQMLNIPTLTSITNASGCAGIALAYSLIESRVNLSMKGNNNIVQLFLLALTAFRYFRLGPDAPLPLTKQLGTVRTNCMDNLDRTNVVQASLAKWTLNKQLREAGIIGAQSSIEEYPTFFQNFRESESI